MHSLVNLVFPPDAPSSKALLEIFCPPDLHSLSSRVEFTCLSNANCPLLLEAVCFSSQAELSFFFVGRDLFLFADRVVFFSAGEFWSNGIQGRFLGCEMPHVIWTTRAISFTTGHVFGPEIK